ncbi:FHA domain-containing protein [bacterium D16-51]|nr:FHA domain-containing protein [bacterium D16-59]RKI54939.1 FHA domain-containing protein [bacterium D16-51]
MLRIAICDRDKNQQSQLLGYIANNTEISDDYVTECFSDAHAVQKRLKERDFNFDLLFLGLEADGKEGLFLASYMREQKVDIDIIFLALNHEFIEEGFRFKAFNFLIKPLTYERFHYEMEQYLREREEYQSEYLSVLVQGKEQMVSLNMVEYFVSDARKIGVVTANKKEPLWFYGKMNELEKRIAKFGFLRCHQSYLVNIHRIISVSSEQIQTKNDVFPVSRKYSVSIREEWEKYKKNCKMLKIGKDSGKDGDSRNSEIVVADESSTVIITKNFAMGAAKYGIVVGIRGARQNDIFRLYQDEEMVLGRDGKQSQIVLSDSTVSRKHCGIRFDGERQCYYVCDFSSNGTFAGGRQKLEKNKWVRIERDTLIQLANDKCSFMLL